MRQPLKPPRDHAHHALMCATWTRGDQIDQERSGYALQGKPVERLMSTAGVFSCTLRLQCRFDGPKDVDASADGIHRVLKGVCDADQRLCVPIVESLS